MVYRFTLDSATEFLFGKNVRSLSAGLVYPKSSPLSNDVAFINHPANLFAYAFAEAQSISAYRGRFGPAWRLAEFWIDRVAPHMDVCYKFIEPIVKDALEKKRLANDNKNTADKDADIEADTLLEHLVNYTEGMLFSAFLSHTLTTSDRSHCH